MKIAIASGKGGTGKTTLSTNLAAFLAKKRQVILADLDVEEPNSGLFIGGELMLEEEKYKMIPEWNESSCTLCGNCQKVCNFHAIIQLGPSIMVFPELCHSCYACSELCPTDALPMKKRGIGILKHFHDNNLDFLESKLNIGEEQAVPLIERTLEFTEANFNSDTLRIFDSPPGTSCPVIEVTKNSDYIILVTEPTPFGLHDLLLAVDTMRELKKDFGVVINRYGVGNDDVINYCNDEGITIIEKINNSKKIAEIYSTGKLIIDEVPEFRKSIERIADHITKIEKS